MINRKAIVGLAIFTVVCFALAGAMGNHHHGLRQAIGDISWTGMLIGLLLLIVACVVVIARGSRAARARRTT
jgi:branched-subunit amino acid permease